MEICTGGGGVCHVELVVYESGGGTPKFLRILKCLLSPSFPGVLQNVTQYVCSGNKIGGAEAMLHLHEFFSRSVWPDVQHLPLFGSFLLEC